jgi:hypothetical protein
MQRDRSVSEICREIGVKENTYHRFIYKRLNSIIMLFVE